ncbi:hypothetical protein [Natronomonas salsuginis]|jgi:hypothetical protein|uniref:DUF8135 domain-containing protein n=1 Tax=Natronomonas salsuginis TaxID=2217661 RepID=A0A4U5JDC4_9EURY|nr:hypothetical protein [Natronomonas salsuginis]TKR26276.1 hypothetical protein DM868_07230 [Natronomonas salsuginis]
MSDGPSDESIVRGRFDGSDPFAELDDIDAAGIETDDPFEEMEIDPVDKADVWAAIDEAGDGSDELTTALNGATEAETVVPKERYCATCEYFSKPPETACTNPGTEIVELVGVDSFRVRNCPVVERHREESVVSDAQ